MLEFRILANDKHDKDAIEPALTDPAMKPPRGYKWARLGEVSTGTNPKFTNGTRSRISQQEWKKDLYAGTDVYLTGKDASGSEQDRGRSRFAATPSTR